MPSEIGLPKSTISPFFQTRWTGGCFVMMPSARRAHRKTADSDAPSYLHSRPIGYARGGGGVEVVW